MAIQLVTFGGLQAVDDINGPLDTLLGQHSRAALFVYLAVERRVSRELLTAVFWPESDAENARHALRQSLYQLRRIVGGDWIESRAHELAVTGDIRVDAGDFDLALERNDPVSAVRLYRGPFLDGVHLVDLKGWEDWVDARRAQYARAFRRACRELIEQRRAAGDLTGAIRAAEAWAARDPFDGEAQHRLIDTLAVAGERVEAIRQFETYRRRLEPDGLRPLDETVALAERLQSDATPLPTGRIAPAPLVTTMRELRDAPAQGRGGRRLIAAALGGTLVVAAAWGLLRRPAGPAPSSTATTIAVLPFTVRGSEAVAYLSDGVVSLLGTALDGAGSLRPVDSRAVFAAVREAGAMPSDPARAARIAARIGASMFVLGDVVEAGGRLHVEAAVYSSGTPPRARASVTGHADSVFGLVDRLAARLLGELGDPRADRLLRTASLTSASLPAFKNYLQAEGLMRAGQFERAAEAYLAAIADDSTFALAHYRLALAREWAPLPGEEAAAGAATRHAARLSARDRALLHAFREWRAGRAIEAERAYRAILARYPDDIEAWFQLGEILFHHGPLLGRSLADSEDIWRTVLAFEPRNLFATAHLARIAVMQRRASLVDSLLWPFSSRTLGTDRRLAEIVLLRATARGDTAAARHLALDLRDWESLSAWRAAAWLTAFAPDPPLMSMVLRDLSVGFASPGLDADLQWFVSLLDLAAGRARAADSALASASASEDSVPAARRRHGFRAATAWYAATLPLPYEDSTLARLRAAVASTRGSGPLAKAPLQNEMGMGAAIRVDPLRAYTLGILSLRLGDTASAVDAAEQLRRLAASDDAPGLVRDLDRGLRARLAARAGHPEEALHLLESLELGDSQGEIAVTPFVSRASERFLRGEVLTALKRYAEALPWFEALGYGSVTEIPLRAPSHLRQAELHDRLGHRAEAALHYARFLELRQEADAGFQREVAAARQRLAELSRPN